VVGGLPGWELVREQPPGTAAPHYVENGIQDFADRMESRPANTLGRGQKRVKPRELSIRQVGQVGSPRSQTPAIVPRKTDPRPGFQTVFRLAVYETPRVS